MKLKDIKIEQSNLHGEWGALITARENDGGRVYTDAEKARVGQITERLVELKDLREEHEAHAAYELSNGREVIDPAAATPEQQSAMHAAGVIQTAREVADEAPKPFRHFGEQLQAVYAAKMGDGGAREKLLHVLDTKAAAQGSGEATDADGGFLVQMDFAAGILRRMYESSQFLSRVRRIPISGSSNGLTLRTIDETDRATGSRLGAVRGYWVDEGDTIPASRPKFGKLELKLNKVAALGYASDELLQDASALSAVMTDAFNEELGFLVEEAIYTGSGAGKPFGVMDAAALITVAKETGQGADSLASENLSKMWARLWVRSRGGSEWFINQDVEPELDFLAQNIGTGGTRPGFVTYGPDGVLRIKGRPIVATEHNETLGDLGDVLLADFSEYLLIDKGGIAQAQSMHVAFVTDETAFRATYRVDGQPAWKAALTPFKGTGKTVSPFVALAARA